MNIDNVYDVYVKGQIFFTCVGLINGDYKIFSSDGSVEVCMYFYTIYCECNCGITAWSIDNYMFHISGLV